jgi:hypothetical protein
MNTIERTPKHSYFPSHLARSSAQWGKLNLERFSLRGQRSRPDNGDSSSGLQAEIAELRSIAADQRSLFDFLQEGLKVCPVGSAQCGRFA